MAMTKRDFLKGGLLAATAGAMSAGGAGGAAAQADGPGGGDFGHLPDLAAGAAPISPAEYRARQDKARRLMREAGIAALVLEPGASLAYFTGLELWRSERFHGAVLPADGEVVYISPAFEAPKLEELIIIPGDMRVWEEHEDPFIRVAQALADAGLTEGRIGMEATVRFFVADGIAAAAPDFTIAPAEPVVTGCRAIKSAHEIALMQTAFDITMAAYRAAVPKLEAGMTPADFRAMMDAATRAMGGRPTFTMALFGEASAYPHGSSRPQILAEGDIVLMDCGCDVMGYKSDISRTLVFGEASARQREVWTVEKTAQLAAFEAAQPGAPCGAVDAAARAVLEKHGFGPGYATPGLPHRTGHGIGMETHESPNFVKDSDIAIAPGMCFSNEPGIYIYGEFGVRLEDCIFIAGDGPRWFTTPAPSLDAPLA